MTNWIHHPTTLNGETVELIPLERAHFPELEELARDKRIWEFSPSDSSNPATFLYNYNLALEEREKGNQYPFTIFHKKENKIIGSTRYLDVQPKHRKLEIGATWLQPLYWATEVNLECKLLLLTFCFETLKTVRVQLKTDENNLRSRKAIQKIGAQFEGILRNDMIKENNATRNSAYYSIIDSEWNAAKAALTGLFNSKKTPDSK